MGATTIVALTVARLWLQALYVVAFSMFSTSLFDASGPDFLFLGIKFGNLFGVTVLAMAVLFLARYGISSNPNFSSALRRILVPHLWDQADTMPATLTDYSKRWYVTVAAATGCVVGVVITDPEICDVIHKALSANQIFYTLFLTVVSITLIGPGEELAMGWSRRSSDGKEEDRPSPFEELFQKFSVRSLRSVLLVALAWLVLNMVHKRMDDALVPGKFETATVMLFACVPAGIITYYWCAALQRGVPSVARTAARASALATGLLFFPYATFAFMDALLEMIVAVYTKIADDELAGVHSGWEFLSQGPATGMLGVLLAIITLVLAAAAALIFSGFLYGVIAYLGGRVLDRDKDRPDRASAVTIVWLVLFLVLWNGLLAWLAFNWLDTRHIKDWQWGLSSFYFLGGDVVWGIGLWISGFPKIVEHARARSSGARGKARTAPR